MGKMPYGGVDQQDRHTRVDRRRSEFPPPLVRRGKKKSVCWRLGQIRNANAAAAPIPVCCQATPNL